MKNIDLALTSAYHRFYGPNYDEKGPFLKKLYGWK